MKWGGAWLHKVGGANAAQKGFNVGGVVGKLVGVDVSGEETLSGKHGMCGVSIEVSMAAPLVALALFERVVAGCVFVACGRHGWFAERKKRGEGDGDDDCFFF